MSRLLSVTLALLVGLFLLGRLLGSAEEPSPQSAVPTAAPSRLPAASPRPPLAVVPPESRTPTIDLLARLEGRRRLFRAARTTYFDSLFAETDSVVRRWPAGNREPLLVAVPVSDSSQYDAEVVSVMRRAAAIWEDAGLGLRIMLTTDTSGARIVARGAAQLDAERAGQTDLQWARDGAIQSAVIMLARRDRTGKPIPDAGRLAVAVHEIGHALGLGHSPNPEDVMFQSTRTSRLSDRDRSTFALLYALPLGTIREIVTP